MNKINTNIKWYAAIIIDYDKTADIYTRVNVRVKNEK